MARQHFPSLLSSILLLSLSFLTVSGQYIQTYVIQNQLPNGREIRLWRPTSQDQWQEVIDVHPYAVFLEYNCYYMTAICRNADNFFESTRGLNRGMDNTLFHLDFSTRKRSPRGRSSYRRSQSCPTGWVAANNCPHTDQETVWRHDGAWWTTALAPPPDGLNFILAPLVIGPVTRESGVYYTCDEFPAASWIEGGDGTGIAGNGREGGASQTRCAGFQCRSGVKAEQNWQATAHRYLRYELKRIINGLGIWPPGVDRNKQIAGFHFRMTSSANGVAARVIGYSALDPDVVDNTRPVSQAKRDEQSPEEFRRWANTVTMEELEKLTSGTLSQHIIYSNESTPASPEDGEDEEDEESDKAWRELLQRSLAAASRVTNLREVNGVKKVPSHSVDTTPSPDTLNPNPIVKRNATVNHAPLVKNTTMSAIERARKIVDKAIDESSKLNAARLANPLRNRYELKPGTVTGALKIRQNKDKDAAPVHQLLNITDEIAAAAALVAEDDARQNRHNVTQKVWKAAAAASQSGSYWMEHIARKGSVPWGDDPSYKVYRNVVDYGAVGDGVTDDTKAINKAMQDGKRCGEKCNGSTTKNAIIYFPPGKYLISTTIEMPFGTQVIGDVSAPIAGPGAPLLSWCMFI